MIESAVAFSQQQDDSSFRQWQTSMAASRARAGGASMRYDVNDRTAGPIPVFGSLLARETMLASALLPGDAPTMTEGKTDIAYDGSGGDSFEFADIIDMVNPLQHLPVVGMLYRKFTGDTIKPLAQIVGGAVFGGPIGAVGGTINAVVQTHTGKDIGSNMMALVNGEESFKARTPSLTYEAAANPAVELEGTTLAVANLSVARDGRENFAARTLYNTLRVNV